MKKSDLYREWARVLDMCEGTNVDPGLCWKCDGVGGDINSAPRFIAHPDRFSFAIAILDNKPVFVGDKVWYTSLNRFVEIKNAIQIELLIRDGQAAWQPPKKTFTLNGEELPCPDWELGDNYSANLEIDGGHGHRVGVKFRSKCDRDKVADAIIKLLKDATK